MMMVSRKMDRAWQGKFPSKAFRKYSKSDRTGNGCSSESLPDAHLLQDGVRFVASENRLYPAITFEAHYRPTIENIIVKVLCLKGNSLICRFARFILNSKTHAGPDLSKHSYMTSMPINEVPRIPCCRRAIHLISRSRPTSTSSQGDHPRILCCRRPIPTKGQFSPTFFHTSSPAPAQLPRVLKGTIPVAGGEFLRKANFHRPIFTHLPVLLRDGILPPKFPVVARANPPTIDGDYEVPRIPCWQF
jgi:hypothetical protein